MSDLVIRPGRDDDLEGLVTLWREYMGDGYHELVNMKWSEQNTVKWRTFARYYISQGLFLVAEEKGSVIGFISLNICSPPFETIYQCAEVIDIYVAKIHRGKGYGRRLLRHVMSFLKDRGIEVVTLSVLTSNKEALRLYREEGFEEVFYTLKKKL
ncbi:MAG: GNAT family N-acetyltransferase [Candidatus Eremiobacteraeota bacterium]|nr:GNAT family N-acetyltransferase [Candidatus Eremiobacteraeota bacterium]